RPPASPREAPRRARTPPRSAPRRPPGSSCPARPPRPPRTGSAAAPRRGPRGAARAVAPARRRTPCASRSWSPALVGVDVFGVDHLVLTGAALLRATPGAGAGRLGLGAGLL